MKEQMRAEFEAWLIKFSSAELGKDNDGDYIDWQVQISWCGFKAAWQHQQAKIDSLQAVLSAVPAQEPTFDELTKLLMQAATKEGHKVTMKIKWAQTPVEVKE